MELSRKWRSGDTSAYFNAAYDSATASRIDSGEYNFAPAALAAIADTFIDLDHDQRLTGSVGVSQQWHGTTFSADAVAGSGLRRRYLNGDHLPSYVTADLAANPRVMLGGFGRLEVQLSVLNVLDRIYEIRDGSGVGAPQWGMRRTICVGVGKPFVR